MEMSNATLMAPDNDLLRQVCHRILCNAFFVNDGLLLCHINFAELATHLNIFLNREPPRNSFSLPLQQDSSKEFSLLSPATKTKYRHRESAMPSSEADTSCYDADISSFEAVMYSSEEETSSLETNLSSAEPELSIWPFFDVKTAEWNTNLVHSVSEERAEGRTWKQLAIKYPWLGTPAEIRRAYSKLCLYEENWLEVRGDITHALEPASTTLARFLDMDNEDDALIILHAARGWARFIERSARQRKYHLTNWDLKVSSRIERCIYAINHRLRSTSGDEPLETTLDRVMGDEPPYEDCQL